MLSFLLLTFAASAQYPDVDCNDARTQLDMNICAHRDFKQADAEMNTQWKLNAADAKAADEGWNKTYDNRPGFFETLLAGQRGWLIYRDRQCESEGFYVRGGSMEPMVISGCRAKITRARTEQLKNMLEAY